MWDGGPVDVLLERHHEQELLAAEVVRAERSMTRRRARDAMRQRVVLARCADALAVCALFLPWTRGSAISTFGGVQTATSAHDGAHVIWVLSLGLVAVVVRQLVATTAYAEPERRMALLLYVAAVLTAFSNGWIVARILAAGSRATVVYGPVAFAAATLLASLATVWAARHMTRALVAPNVLAGVHFAAPEQVRARLGGLTAGAFVRVGGALVDRPSVRILGTASLTCLATALGGWVTGLSSLVPVLPAVAGVGVSLGLMAAAVLYEAVHRDRLPWQAVTDAYVRLTGALRPPDQPYYVYL